MQPSNGIGEFGYGGWMMLKGLGMVGDVGEFGYGGGCQGMGGDVRLRGLSIYGRGCWRVWIYMICFVVTWMNRSICVNCTCTMYTLMHSFASPPLPPECVYEGVAWWPSG